MTPLSSQCRALEAEEIDLLQGAEVWRPELTLDRLSRAGLHELALQEGHDFAMAVLHDRILREPRHRRLADLILAPGLKLPPDIDLLGVVPGAFYRNHKNTGADGKRILELAQGLGLRAEVVPTRSFGSVRENAQIISHWLKERRSLRLAFLSLSKGASDLREFFNLPSTQTIGKNVSAWVSFSGIAQGTALVSWLRARPLRHLFFRLLLRLQRHNPDAIDDLDPETCSAAPWPQLPDGLCIVHVYGFPMKRHLHHPWAARAYERLAPLGPNDGGGVLLGDLPALPGYLCPIWGADHYLSPGCDIASLLRNIVFAALTEGRSRHTTLSAHQPTKVPASKSYA